MAIGNLIARLASCDYKTRLLISSVDVDVSLRTYQKLFFGQRVRRLPFLAPAHIQKLPALMCKSSDLRERQKFCR